MATVNKVITGNSYVDEIVYYCKLLGVDTILKNPTDVVQNETIVSLKNANLYLKCQDGTVSPEYFGNTHEIPPYTTGKRLSDGLDYASLHEEIVCEYIRTQLPLEENYWIKLTRDATQDPDGLISTDLYNPQTKRERMMMWLKAIEADHIKFYSVPSVSAGELYTSQVEKGFNDTSNTIEMDQFVKFARQYIINHYVEMNNYYRMLNGKPGYETDPVNLIYIKESDITTTSTNGTVFNKKIPLGIVGKIKNKYLHELDAYIIDILESYGVIDLLKQQHLHDRNFHYLYYLGTKMIDPGKARTTIDFGYLRLPSIDNVELYNRFKDRLDANREYILKAVYSEAYKYGSDLYDHFICVLIITISMVDIICSIQELLAKKEIFDSLTIRYIFESNGIPFYSEIPLKYQIAMVKNLNLLLKYKSTHKNIVDICSLFGFQNIQAFKYYILRSRKLDQDGNWVFIDTISYHQDTQYPKDTYVSCNDRFAIVLNTFTSDNTEESVDLSFDKDITSGNLEELSALELKEEELDLRFIKVPYEEDVFDYVKNTNFHYSYEDITSKDFAWATTTSTEVLKQQILAEEFNMIRSKYVSIDSVFDAAKAAIQQSYLFNLMFMDKNIIFDSATQKWVDGEDGNFTEENKLLYLCEEIKIIIGGSECNLGDIFAYLFALSYEYNGINNRILLYPDEIETATAYNKNQSIEGYNSFNINSPLDKFKLYIDDILAHGKRSYEFISSEEPGSVIMVECERWDIGAVRYVEGYAPGSFLTSNSKYYINDEVNPTHYISGEDSTGLPIIEKIEESIPPGVQTVSYSPIIIRYFKESPEIISDVEYRYALRDKRQTIKSGGLHRRKIEIEVSEEIDLTTNAPVKFIQFYRNLPSEVNAEDDRKSGIFRIPSEAFKTTDMLIDYFNKNLEAREFLTYCMINAEDIDEYNIYNEIYEALFVSDRIKGYFFRDTPDEETGIRGQYPTYQDYLQNNNSYLYNSLLSIIPADRGGQWQGNDESKRTTIQEMIHSVIDQLITIEISDNFKYIFSGISTVSSDYVRGYLEKIIEFFKSYKITLLHLDTIYKFDDKFSNTCIVLERIEEFNSIFKVYTGYWDLKDEKYTTNPSNLPTSNRMVEWRDLFAKLNVVGLGKESREITTDLTKSIGSIMKPIDGLKDKYDGMNNPDEISHWSQNIKEILEKVARSTVFNKADLLLVYDSIANLISSVDYTDEVSIKDIIFINIIRTVEYLITDQWLTIMRGDDELGHIIEEHEIPSSLNILEVLILLIRTSHMDISIPEDARDIYSTFMTAIYQDIYERLTDVAVYKSIASNSDIESVISDWRINQTYLTDLQYVQKLKDNTLSTLKAEINTFIDELRTCNEISAKEEYQISDVLFINPFVEG